MKFLIIFYLISFMFIGCCANIEWGDKPANFVQRFICTIFGSLLITLSLGIWLYGVVSIVKNII